MNERVSRRRSITDPLVDKWKLLPYYASKRVVTRVRGCPLSGDFRVATKCPNLAEMKVPTFDGHLN